MEIEIVVRMEANNERDSFDDAEYDIKKFFFHQNEIIVNNTQFRNFNFMAAQPIEDLHDYEEVRRVGRPRKQRCSNGKVEPCNCAMH